MPERRAKPAAKKDKTLREARAVHSVPDTRDWATTRLSGKNQITIPAAMVRDMGWEPGDPIELWIWKDSIHVRKLGTEEEEVARLAGSLKHLWGTKEEADEFIRNERASWDREWDPD